MTDDQPGPNRRTLTEAYRQAGYTIEDAPRSQGADAAALWVAHDEQPIAVIKCLRNPTKPGALLRKVDQLSRHARIHLVAGSRRIASRVREYLQDPVRRRADCGVECYRHPAQFVLDGTRLAVSEPHVWIATTDDQSPPDGTVLSVPVTLATPSGGETERANLTAGTSKKRPGYESAITEMNPTQTPSEISSLVREPVITDQSRGDYGVVIAVLSEGALTEYDPARNRVLNPLRHDKTPPGVLADGPWELAAPPMSAVTQVHLVARSEWESK